MKTKIRFFSILLIGVLLSSCSNNLKTPKETSVKFYMDRATVREIVKTPVNGRSSREAQAQETEPQTQTNYYIDVSLCGDEDQTQTVPLADEITLEFKDVLVNSRVYAKAQIYTYLDEEKTVKDVIFRGESQKITVRNTGNILSIKLATATLVVTFDSNGGSPVASQKVITGCPVEEPANPVKPEGKKQYSKENYAFAGWYTDPELTKAYNFELPVTDDLTLYAKWLPDFVYVEGATVDNYLATGRNIKISDLYISDHEVTQTEYFAVTNENPSNNKKSDEKADEFPVENVTWFEALAYCNKLSKKEGLMPCYTINDSTNPDEWGTLKADTQVICSLSSNGYRLPTEAEWEYISTKSYRSNKDLNSMALYDQNSEGKTWEVDNRLADELCLCNILGNVAEWCFDVYSTSLARSTGPTGPMIVSGADNYRVVRGGSYQSTKDECSSTARASANPTEKSPAIGFRVVRTVVYEYKIIKNTVTFDSNGGSAVSVQIVINGDTATRPADPTRTGYIFQGWTLPDETDSFDFGTQINQDINLTAKWSPVTYHVTFDYNPITGLGGSGDVSEFSATYDQVITLPASNTIHQPTGYHFYRWSLSPTELTLDYDVSNPQIKNLASTQDADVTLYVIWEENGVHHIEYHDYENIKEGDNVDISGLLESFRESEDITALGTLAGTRRGYTFAGWQDAGGNSVSSWTRGTYDTDLDLYAQWTPITYTVRFKSRNSNTTGSMSDQTMTYDTATELTECNYALTGYNFVGWSTTENSAIKDYDDKQSVQNLTYQQGDVINLYALWTPTLYKVKYNLDGGAITGTLYDDTIGYYDKFTIESSDFTLPTTTISKNGAVFDGWYTSSTDFSADKKITKIEHGSYYDKEVYAKWNYLITFTLISGDWSSSGGGSELSMTIKADGATVTDATPVTGTTIVFTPSFTQTGYTCTWKIDGSAPDSSWATVNSTTNELTLTTTGITPGVYAIQFTASKGSSYESYYAQIRIN